MTTRLAITRRAPIQYCLASAYIHPGARPLDRWNVLNGYPELTAASWAWQAQVGGRALRLVHGGVFDRFPTAKMILGHMGEFFSSGDLIPGIKLKDQDLERLPSEYFGRNIFTTTSGMSSPSALAALVIGAHSGDESAMKLLLDRGPDAKFPLGGSTALMEAAGTEKAFPDRAIFRRVIPGPQPIHAGELDQDHPLLRWPVPLGDYGLGTLNEEATAVLRDGHLRQLTVAFESIGVENLDFRNAVCGDNGIVSGHLRVPPSGFVGLWPSLHHVFTDSRPNLSKRKSPRRLSIAAMFRCRREI
jgi:hypothetical protein